MYKFLIIPLLMLAASFHSCIKKDPVRTIYPSVTWSYAGYQYSSTSLQIDYQGQIDGYYELIAIDEDANEVNTLIVGLTNGIAGGSHTVSGYYVNFQTYDKATFNNFTDVFQVYSVNVNSYNGNLVSGDFSANNATGPALSGTFTDINAAP